MIAIVINPMPATCSAPHNSVVRTSRARETPRPALELRIPIIRLSNSASRWPRESLDAEGPDHPLGPRQEHAGRARDYNFQLGRIDRRAERQTVGTMAGTDGELKMVQASGTTPEWYNEPCMLGIGKNRNLPSIETFFSCLVPDS